MVLLRQSNGLELGPSNATMLARKNRTVLTLISSNVTLGLNGLTIPLSELMPYLDKLVKSALPLELVSRLYPPSQMPFAPVQVVPELTTLTRFTSAQTYL